MELNPLLDELRLLVSRELTLGVEFQRGKSITEHRIWVLLTSHNLKIIIGTVRSGSLQILLQDLSSSSRLLILSFVVELLNLRN